LADAELPSGGAGGGGDGGGDREAALLISLSPPYTLPFDILDSIKAALKLEGAFL